MARYQLNFLDRSKGGNIGGASTSPDKREASRVNGIKGAIHGIKGGRPVGSGVKRTLAEFLLHRKLEPNDLLKVAWVYEEIFRPHLHRRLPRWEAREYAGGRRSPHYQFRKAFNLEEGRSASEWMKTTKYNQRAEPGPKTREFLKAFRSAARTKLRQQKAQSK